MTYYAYVHARPDTVLADGIFYVGKGLLRRAKNVFGRNKHHQNVVAKHGAAHILVGTIACSREAAAFDLEKGLIKCLRRMGVSLTNKTDGGEGAVGAERSADTRAKISAARKGMEVSAETREKLSRIHSGKVISAGQRLQIAEANRSRDPSIYRKLAETLRGRKASDETKRKLSASLTGKKRSSEQIKNITAANSGRVYSEEARKNMAEAARKVWAKRKESAIAADSSNYTTESNHG